eukprot:scaffold33106_cov70-Phaeocystis_antarctica.AAC.6
MAAFCCRAAGQRIMLMMMAPTSRPPMKHATAMPATAPSSTPPLPVSTFDGPMSSKGFLSSTSLAAMVASLVAIVASEVERAAARCLATGWSPAISTQMYSTFALVLSMERTWSPIFHGPEFPLRVWSPEFATKEEPSLARIRVAAPASSVASRDLRVRREVNVPAEDRAPRTWLGLGLGLGLGLATGSRARVLGPGAQHKGSTRAALGARLWRT